MLKTLARLRKKALAATLPYRDLDVSGSFVDPKAQPSPYREVRDTADHSERRLRRNIVAGRFHRGLPAKRLVVGVYPTVFFAIWHISPEMVQVNPDAGRLISLVPAVGIGIRPGGLCAVLDQMGGDRAQRHVIGIIAYGIPLSTSAANILSIPLQ